MKMIEIASSSTRQIMWRTILTLCVIVASGVSFIPRAQAQSDDATKILKTMSDYIAGQKSISLTFDADIEVITSEMQKIQFTSSGQVELNRPDKLRAVRTGGYSDIELVFDGKMLTINNKDSKSYAQVDVPGSTDQLIDTLREKHAIVAPGADFLLSGVFGVLTADVINSKHIGVGVVDGVECEHLAFRNLDTDWQIWIETGARPIPRKYVITNKGVVGAPQYTLRIKEWRTAVSADAFTFKPAQDAKKVALEALADIDELPPGTLAAGDKK